MFDVDGCYWSEEFVNDKDFEAGGGGSIYTEIHHCPDILQTTVESLDLS